MAPTPQAPHDSTEVVVLDGGLATTLAAGGVAVDGPLWSARAILDEPDAITAAHTAFLDAGAQVVTTASYQLSAQGLVAAGIDPGRLDLLLARSVELARAAVTAHAARTGAPPALVAASVGPYGAVLADGSEYRGRYGRTVDELRRFHAERLGPLAAAGPDLLAVETLPAGAEVTALAPLLSGLGIPAWVSLTTDASGTTTPEGQPLLDALAPALGVDEVIAVGVNCCPPDAATQALAYLHERVNRPLVTYPNVGDRWDPTARRWLADPGPDIPAAAARWIASGVRFLGGCCGTSPAHIAAVAAAARTGR